MPSIYDKNIRRLIRSTKGRFFSLTAIVAIGVAFFVGVSSSSQIMAASVDAYDDEIGLKDITVYSDYGFNQNDIEAIQNLDDVSRAEGTYFLDVNAVTDDSTLVTRLHAFDPNAEINKVVLVSGRLPENKHEALAEGAGGYHTRFDIGETVKLTRPDSDLSDYMSIDQVTIVGMAETPLYLNITKEVSTLSNQPLTTFLYVPQEAFNTEFYTEVNVLIRDGMKENSFGSAYAEYDEQVKNEIESLASTQVSVRKEEVLDKAWNKYNDGLKDYEDGQKEFDDKITDAEKEISDGEQEIKDGEQAIADAKKTLADSQKELDEQQISGSIKINDARAELSKAEGTLNEGKKELAAKRVEYGKQIEDLRAKEALIDQALSGLTASIENIEGLEKIKFLYINDTSIVKVQDFTAKIKSMHDAQLITDEEYNYIGSLLSGIPDTGPIGELTRKIDYFEQQILILLNKNMGTNYQTLDDLKNAKTEMETNRALIESGISQIESGLADAQRQLDEGEAKISRGYEECVNASVELDQKVADAQKQIDDGYSELTDKEADIAQAKIDIADAKVKLEDSRKDGQQELEDAKAKLSKAKQDIEDLEDGSWTVLDRATSHYASVTYKDTVDQMKAIAAIFPVFFFAVAALVCITTMTRMVDEQRGQIGILRALGYTRARCTRVYLTYALAATAAGMIIGDILGLMIFPAVIYTAWKMMYNLPAMSSAVPWNWIAFGDVCFLGVMALATWYACRNDMREVPSDLMRPKAPKLGRSSLIEQVPMIWKHLSFTWKVTVRNLLRYKKRLFMTVIGVAGCTALLITG
ncbi:MAG: ABC transporter permease, partial [Erysipelotrichia bacterium]|nr:ABC transporter permease [Erysipelotrichia bacterium]